MANNSRFNPQAMKEGTSFKNQKKKQQKNEKQKRHFQKKAPNELETKVSVKNSRKIDFAPKRLQNFFSWCFFLLFFAMTFVVILSFGRLDTLTNLALSKSVNPVEISNKVIKQTTSADVLKFKGKLLVDRLYNIPSGKSEQWEKELTPFLANGLTPSLINSAYKEEMKAQNIRFVEMNLGKKSNEYALTYAFDLTVGEHTQTMQVELMVYFKDEGILLLERPSLSPIKEKAANDVPYNQGAFYPKGHEVSSQVKENVETFLNQFFNLYVSNDRSLALISKVKGIGNATFSHLEVEAIKENQSGNLLVYGTYDFQFKDTETMLHSVFEMKLKQTKESYYVLEMNN